MAARLCASVPDHVLSLVAGVVAGCVATVALALATRVRLLPEVVDVSIVPTVAGVFSIVIAAFGASIDTASRLGRLTLFGTLLGAAHPCGARGWCLVPCTLVAVLSRRLAAPRAAAFA